MHCWSCKGDHDTVAKVRLCHQRNDYKSVGLTARVRHEPSVRRREDRRQNLYQQLKALSAKVEEGPYAIRNGPKATNDISFYQVDKPTTGQWAGRTFVNRRLSDDTQRLSLDEQVRVLAILAADPQGASLLYGQTIGECPECGRSLTNETSRERGIGPKCARKRGYMDLV